MPTMSESAAENEKVALPAGSVVAVRGAVQAAENSPESILGATVDVLSALMEVNGIGPDHMVSGLFTVTPDLDAEFPAAAGRSLGLDAVPLICSREIPVPGAMAKVIRVLIHFRLPEGGASPVPVYLGETRELRPDLEGPA
jgi:chorismate mutase